LPTFVCRKIVYLNVDLLTKIPTVSESSAEEQEMFHNKQDKETGKITKRNTGIFVRFCTFTISNYCCERTEKLFDG
jgi:hypothetical protein